jgi:hypothetical protein
MNADLSCLRHHILVAPLDLGLPRGWSGKLRQRPRDTPGLWDSLETPGEVAKLAPRDERLTGDAGSKVHLDGAHELGLKAPARTGLGSTPPRCMSQFKACIIQTDRNRGKTRQNRNNEKETICNKDVCRQTVDIAEPSASGSEMACKERSRHRPAGRSA